MTDDRHDERPDRPKWAAVPTMPWSRVPPERRDAGATPADETDHRRYPADPAGHSPSDQPPHARTSHGQPSLGRAADGAPPYSADQRHPQPQYPESRHPEPRHPQSYSQPPHSQGPHGQPPHGQAPRGPQVYGQAAVGTAGVPAPVQARASVPVQAAPTPAPAAPATPASAGPPATGPRGLFEPAPTSGAVTDPEQALAAVRLNYDPHTLHEQPDNLYELVRIRDALSARIDTADDNPSRARLLGLRAVANRLLGELTAAHSDAKMALAHAEATGQLRRIAVAQCRLANTLVRLGELDEADRLFTQANSAELPDRLRATIHHYAGKCAFEQDRYIEACQHFEKALELRRDTDPELVAATEVALDALFSRVAERGWGAYPRSRDEILFTHKPPTPTFDEQIDRWGYRDEAGEWPVGPQFADVQPFRDGVAWVRPVGIETWGLIDETGRLLIDPRAGYLGVGSFSDGLAWVSRDGLGGWIAIDKTNRVIIPAGFDDVRPFRRGIAIARQGGKWGAVERGGRMAVQFAFDAFATGLADGRYVEGFTDEGLAIVEVGGRKGVIDRTGRVLVPLAYPTIVIHPVAFLFTDASHRWGAVARNGTPLVNPVHASRKAVTDEIEQMLADTRPIL